MAFKYVYSVNFDYFVSNILFKIYQVNKNSILYKIAYIETK